VKHTWLAHAFFEKLANGCSVLAPTDLRSGQQQIPTIASPSEQRCKRGERVFEVREVPGKSCDESEVLEIEAGSYVTAHQGKVT